MSDSHFVIYVIERRRPKERIFGPVAHHGAYATKKEAKAKLTALQNEHPENEYRITGYWDKRPW